MEVIAVVRTCGERTQDRCVELVSRQVKDVRVIHVEPFHEAVRECFRIGIDSGARWLLTVDADVLLNPGAVNALHRQAKSLKGWQVVGRVSDKLYGGQRMAGVRMYRTSALPAVLPQVPEVVRPEGTLARLYSGWEASAGVLGSHDDEQWIRDYYRKGAAHRVKHEAWASRAEAWRKSRDPDLQAAAQGWDGVPLTIKEKGPL